VPAAGAKHTFLNTVPDPWGYGRDPPLKKRGEYGARPGAFDAPSVRARNPKRISRPGIFVRRECLGSMELTDEPTSAATLATFHRRAGGTHLWGLLAPGTRVGARLNDPPAPPSDAPCCSSSM